MITLRLSLLQLKKDVRSSQTFKRLFSTYFLPILLKLLTIFLSTLFGWDVLQPVHLLWINLVTDTFPAIALGVEPAEPGVMTHKPRGRKASFFSGGVLSSIIYQGVLQAALVMSVYGFAIAYPVHVGDNHAIHADALTMAFATLGLIQLFHAYNVKSVYQSILTVGPFKSKTFNWSILGILHPSHGNNRRRTA